MRNMLIVAALGMMLVGVGCQDGKMPWSKKSTTQDTMKMDAGKDDCPWCSGVQHAKADRTCPKCKITVKE